MDIKELCLDLKSPNLVINWSSNISLLDEKELETLNNCAKVRIKERLTISEELCGKLMVTIPTVKDFIFKGWWEVKNTI